MPTPMMSSLDEEGVEVAECFVCGALHFDANMACPDCGRSYLLQCRGTGRNGRPLQTHLNVARAFQARAVRLLEQAQRDAAKAMAYAALAEAKGELE